MFDGYNETAMVARHREGRREALRSFLPPILRWDGYPSAVLNLLIVGLVALLATWVVHQTEYRIEYGNRFAAVMAATPHRFYMEPFGLVLAIAGLVLLALLVYNLLRSRSAVRALLPLIPRRFQGVLDIPPAPIPPVRVVKTAVALGGAQTALYTVQENLERVAGGMPAPGLAVLFAQPHATVLPLHLLVALCAALLLWIAASWLRRARHAVAMARVLANRWAAEAVGPVVPCVDNIPNPLLNRVRRALRSPPLPA